MILITGPTSFIGRSVLIPLSKIYKKSDILCLCWDKDDIVGINNRKVIKKLKLPFTYIDLVTKENLNDIPKSPDTVIHLAANTDTSSRNHEVNDMGTKNLINALGKIGSNTHIIYTSTTTFLGGRKNCNLPLKEESSPHPTNEYGRSKLRAEKYLIKECKKRKFRLTILSLNTVYGPDSRPKSMFSLLPEQIRKRSFFTRLNWPGLTSLVYVDDVVKTIIYFTRNKIPKRGKPQLYILSGESLTMQEICNTMYKALRIKYDSINLPPAIWKIFKILRIYIPYLEIFLPEFLYNPFWRFSLICDNAVWCETKKIKKSFPYWNPKKLCVSVHEVL